MNAGTSTIWLIILYVGLFGGMWALYIRPQKKREQQVLQMQKGVKVGDQIVTNSGLYGKVVDTFEEAVVMEIGTDKTVKVVLDRKGIHAVGAPNLSSKKEQKAE